MEGLNKYKILIFLFGIILVFSASCTKEEMVKPDACFTLWIMNDEIKALEIINEPYTVTEGQVITLKTCGDGEFFTLWPGNEFYDWNEYQAYLNGEIPSYIDDVYQNSNKGKPFISEEIVFSYKDPGSYVLTLVVSSTGDFAEEYEQDIKQVNVDVLPGD